MNQPSEDTRTMADLANNVIRAQDACNLSGLVHSFSKDISRLRVLLTEKLGTGPSTQDMNTHPIVMMWTDKLRDLAFSQWPVVSTIAMTEDVYALASKR